MAAKTWYLTDASVSVGSDLSDSDPGTEAYRSPVTGWIVGTGSTNNSEWFNDTERASNTFTGTTVPDGTLDTSNGDFWVSPAPLTGDFASGNWTVNLAVRANTGGDTQDGNLVCRLFRGANQDGTSAVEITSAQQSGGAVTNLLTSATQVSTATFNPGAFSVSNEYIFIQLAWHRTGAASMTQYDVNARIGNASGEGSSVVTSDFTTAQSVAPSAGLATWVAIGAALATALTITPSAATASWTANAPTVATTISVTPSASSAALAAISPTLLLDISLTPSVAVSTWVGIDGSAEASSGSTLTPTAATAAWTALDPVAYAGYSNFWHFDEASLPPEFTAIQGGTQSVALTDSRLHLSNAGSGNYAGAYYNSKIDKSRSQLWVWEQNVADDGIQGDLFRFISKSTAPVADTRANIAALGLCGIFRGTGAPRTVRLAYTDSGGGNWTWNTSTSAWVSGNTDGTDASNGDTNPDNYFLCGFQIDGDNDRFRMFMGCKSTGASFSNDFGMQVLALTDWVAFSATRFGSSTDLWLVWGAPYTTSATTGDQYVERIRFAADDKTHGYTSQKDTQAGHYLCVHHTAYDGKFFLQEDRTTIAVDVGAGAAWDSNNIKQPRPFRDDDGTYYMYFTADSSTTNFQLGVASASSPDGPWTKYGSNPILTGAGGDETHIAAPFVFKDYGDPDSNKRYKLVYTGQPAGSSAGRTYLATAPAPLGTWTKQGIILDWGTSGSLDEVDASRAIPLFEDGEWQVFYRAEDASANVGVLRAHGTDLASLSKDYDAGYHIVAPLDQAQDISANLSGRTASMTDTTGFDRDQLVLVNQDATPDNWNLSRVRKVTTNTSLELYHAVVGFTTANSAQIRGLMAGTNMDLTAIEKINGLWYWYVNFSQIFGGHPTFQAFCESVVVFVSSSLSGTKPVRWRDSPAGQHGQWSSKRSVGHITFVTGPIGTLVSPSAATATWTAVDPGITAAVTAGPSAAVGTWTGTDASASGTATAQPSAGTAAWTATDASLSAAVTPAVNAAVTSWIAPSATVSTAVSLSASAATATWIGVDGSASAGETPHTALPAAAAATWIAGAPTLSAAITLSPSAGLATWTSPDSATSWAITLTPTTPALIWTALDATAEIEGFHQPAPAVATWATNSPAVTSSVSLTTSAAVATWAAQDAAAAVGGSPQGVNAAVAIATWTVAEPTVTAQVTIVSSVAVATWVAPLAIVATDSDQVVRPTAATGAWTVPSGAFVPFYKFESADLEPGWPGTGLPYRFGDS
jgi:hypothetical protein